MKVPAGCDEPFQDRLVCLSNLPAVLQGLGHGEPCTHGYKFNLEQAWPSRWAECMHGSMLQVLVQKFVNKSGFPVCVGWG